MSSLVNYSIQNNQRVLLLKEQLSSIKLIFTPAELVIKNACEQSFYEFVKHAWLYVEGENPYIDNWHIKAICDHLEAGFYGKIKLLVINVPPRCMKSLLCNVFFPAWCFIKRPYTKIFCLSGGYKLAVRDSVKCRQLITSSWYQKFWGNLFELSKEVNTKERFANTKGGERLVKSVMGSPIGEGGHILIMDDVNTSQDIRSKVTRERTAEFIDSSFLIRQDNTDKAFILCIQQRVHEEDCTAHLLEKNIEGTVHLMLPMEFVPSRKCITIGLNGSNVPWQDVRTQQNELLWPARFSAKHVDRLKQFYGTSYNIESQLQQNPFPESGNIFKKEWFNVWTERTLPHNIEFVIQSWDTALSTDVNACESALTTWGLFKDDHDRMNIILLNLWTGRLEHPDLRRMIKKCGYNYYTRSFEEPDRAGPPADIILIEDSFGGKAIISDLRSSNLPIFGFNPRSHGLKNYTHMTNKADRARLATILAEQKLVWLQSLPSDPERLTRDSERVLRACLACPTGSDQDIIDSLSQAFIYMRRRHFLVPRGEEVIEHPTWDAYYDHEERV